MATGPNPLPPTTILSSHSISQSAAHDFLAAYLDRAATDPARQPNAGISEHGPIARTTAIAPNLMLHNLKRIQAGLAGEVLGRDLSLDNQDGEGADGAQQQGGDWEDAQKYEQEDNAENQDEDGTMEVDMTEQPHEGAVDKEDRKKKKKERRLAEKRAKAKADAGA
ncbi:hypothetical protein FE257_002213 [Aspergillus nanangensis]|uniref:Uncharacterized protein n=1 Tax=Aspergillus nanangensis TaxID=2582783 RepID=A0AAD4GP73_ASPNN|nr:hypothetical protein FE257_002213 [Aspergillus nanangensis]